jgi:hypothetical protein
MDDDGCLSGPGVQEARGPPTPIDAQVRLGGTSRAQARLQEQRRGSTSSGSGSAMKPRGLMSERGARGADGRRRHHPRRRGERRAQSSLGAQVAYGTPMSVATFERQL